MKKKLRLVVSDRTELMEAALECHPKGIALVNAQGRVMSWNLAAERISGFQAADLVGRPAPPELDELLRQEAPAEHFNYTTFHRGHTVQVQSKDRNELTLTAYAYLLRDGIGTRIGHAVIFHPSNVVEMLPHGESDEVGNLEGNQERLRELLEMAHEEYLHAGTSLGLLWIMVDQAHKLRRSHGAQACEAMLVGVGHTLARRLHAGEQIGRWGDDEFLVVAMERTAEALAERGRTLAGLARTTDFRWWGDRVSVTVSIGAAQAECNEALHELLERAQHALFDSMHAGGNRITLAQGRRSCSPL